MLSWDRSHDWVLEQYYEDLARLTIRFENPTPTTAELIALRRPVVARNSRLEYASIFLRPNVSARG